MSHGPSTQRDGGRFDLIDLVLSLPPGRRGAMLQSAVSFRPERSLEKSFEIGPIRAAFAGYWEAICGQPVPIGELRAALDPPVPIKTVLEFTRLTIARSHEATKEALQQIVLHLKHRWFASLAAKTHPPGSYPVNLPPISVSMPIRVPVAQKEENGFVPNRGARESRVAWTATA